jgi:hypothetical protein
MFKFIKFSFRMLPQSVADITSSLSKMVTQLELAAEQHQAEADYQNDLRRAAEVAAEVAELEAIRADVAVGKIKALYS